MTYHNVETALLRQLDAISGFGTIGDEANVTRGDYRVLTLGVGSALVVEYNSFDQRRTQFEGEHEIDWRMDIVAFHRWLDEDTASGPMGTIRQSVIDRLNQYPQLGTTGVFDSMVVSGEAVPDEVEMGGIRYQMEILRYQVTEEISVSYAE